MVLYTDEYLAYRVSKATGSSNALHVCKVGASGVLVQCRRGGGRVSVRALSGCSGITVRFTRGAGAGAWTAGSFAGASAGKSMHGWVVPN